ncbi:sphingosine N-acyltransferase lag1 [Linnemannia zychae]|nr:sphingosine N-acyltransferase lag1 [Linnemannia zychae]
MKDPIKNALTPKADLDSPVFVSTAATSISSSISTSTAASSSSSMHDRAADMTGLRPRMPLQQRNSSYRRKASIDPTTGQPHHYDHRRHQLQDPTFGRSPSPPEGAPKYDADGIEDDGEDSNQPLYRYNKDGFLVPVQKQNEQTWSSFLIQHQLVLSCSVILAVFASHALIVSKEIRDGHNVDLVSSLSAMIPPPIWKSLPATWTRAEGGAPAMVKKWKPKLGAYNPNDAWSSQAMALQYQTVLFDEVTGQRQVVYGKGWNDLYMVLVWVMIWTAIREAAMTFLLIPLGRYLGVGEQKMKLQKSSVQAQEKGVTESTMDAKKALKQKLKKEEHAREGKLLRFAEQGWLVIYDGCMWTFGMCLLYNSSYWSDSTFFWRDYPKTYLDATTKWYYLVQFAFWVQQFLLAVLGIEKRRKDFLEFMIHHVITCLLIGFSYSFNLTSVGHAVLCAMDFSDIVLAACKMLKYCQKDQVADVGFVFFVVTWIYTRHIWFGQIIWSTYKEAPVFATMIWDPNCAQGLEGENSEDVRSEDEEEAEEEVEKTEEEVMTRKSMHISREQAVAH